MNELYGLLILPLLIFIARVMDVSLGTLRIIFISKGFKYLAPVVGFFEIMIWLLAIGQIFQNIANILYYIAYAGGFAMGTFVGISIENKLSIGTEIVRIITRKDATKLIEVLRSEGWEVTTSEAEGVDGRVKVIYTIIDRHDLFNVIETIKKYNPHAFYSVEDIKFVSEKLFPHRRYRYKRPHLNLFRLHRKEK